MRPERAHLPLPPHRTPRLRPGGYTVACSHDGWDTTPTETWWTFNVTIGDDRSATITRQCFINFASLTGNGVYVTVTTPGGDTVTSNYLK